MFEERQQPVFQVQMHVRRPCATPEDRVSGYNAFETPSSKVAIDLRPRHAFYGPNRSQAFRSE